MWDTFLPDLVVALVGAVLTVAIAYSTFLLSVRRNERLALNSLVVELHHRRALSGRGVVIPGAARSRDYERANLSVLSMREEIRTARDRVRSQLLHQALQRMTRACNRYLERAEWDADRYAILLVELRRDLTAEVDALRRARRGLQSFEPGAGAFGGGDGSAPDRSVEWNASTANKPRFRRSRT